MPSENRRQFMHRKVKHEYAQCRGETNQERIRFLLQFAEVSVDNARCHVSACAIISVMYALELECLVLTHYQCPDSAF
jgi:hypothetical protein